MAEEVRLPRFYPLLDTGLVATRHLEPLAAAEALLEAGCAILQFRHKEHWTPAVLKAAQSVAALCLRSGCEFVVNDRADIALLIDASVHVGQDDLLPSDVRRILAQKKCIGFSTHNEQQLREAAEQPADYLALGPIFNTGSKQNPDPLVGIDELRRLRPFSDKPLVAIGGISRASASQVWDAGADSIAVVADLYLQGCGKKEIRTSAEEWVKLANEYSAN